MQIFNVIILAMAGLVAAAPQVAAPNAVPELEARVSGPDPNSIPHVAERAIA